MDTLVLPGVESALDSVRSEPILHSLNPKCRVPCNYTPKRSNPLLQAREVLRLLAEEGIEGSGKEAEPRGDGD